MFNSTHRASTLFESVLPDITAIPDNSEDSFGSFRVPVIPEESSIADPTIGDISLGEEEVIYSRIDASKSIKQVPAIFILMSGRMILDYVACLKKIKDILPGDIRLESFMIDLKCSYFVHSNFYIVI